MSNSDFPRLRYSDVEEILVLGEADFLLAANSLVAEADPTARTSSVNVQGCSQLDICVDVTLPRLATTLYIKVRFSGKSDPDTSVLRDWGYVQTDNIDSATGISSVQEYMIEIDLTKVNGVALVAPRRYVSRIQRISGRYASAVVWVDAPGSSTAFGSVYFLRQGGSM